MMYLVFSYQSQLKSFTNNTINIGNVSLTVNELCQFFETA